MTKAKAGESKIARYAKKIQERAREIKKQHPNIQHRDAIKLASKKLKEEGYFRK